MSGHIKVIKMKVSKLKEICKEKFKIKLAFTSFETKNYVSCKDPISDDLKSFLVYKSTFCSCTSSYLVKYGVI